MITPDKIPGSVIIDEFLHQLEDMPPRILNTYAAVEVRTFLKLIEHAAHGREHVAGCGESHDAEEVLAALHHLIEGLLLVIDTPRQ